MYTINTKFPLRDLGFSNALAIDELPRHRWYFVKEGFSPKLVEQAIAIDGVNPGEVLLNPFSVAGQCLCLGRSADYKREALK